MISIISLNPVAWCLCRDTEEYHLWFSEGFVDFWKCSPSCMKLSKPENTGLYQELENVSVNKWGLLDHRFLSLSSLCSCNVKTAIGDAYECGCVPLNFIMDTGNLDFSCNFHVSWDIIPLLVCQPLNNTKITLSSIWVGPQMVSLPSYPRPSTVYVSQPVLLVNLKL